MTNSSVSIYALINPLNDHVFYVGCTIETWNRLKSHISEAKKDDNNDFKSIVIREILKSGKDVEILTLEKCDIKEASFLEEFYINLFRFYGFDLPQWSISTYTLSFKDREFLNRSGVARLNVPKLLMDGIKSLSDIYCIDKDILVKIALKEFVERNKVVLDTNDYIVTKRHKEELRSKYNYFKIK